VHECVDTQLHSCISPISRHWVLSDQLAYVRPRKGRPYHSLRTQTCKRLGSHGCARGCTLPCTFSPAKDTSLPHGLML
jgi:hypothetical protein